VTKNGFTFPSHLLKQVQTDGDMVDIYHGEELQVATEEKNLTPNIPLDPAGADKTPKRIVWEKRFRVFQHGMSMAGIIVSAVSMYIAPSFFVGGLLILQILLYGGFARLVKPKKPDGWGIVYDKNSTKPLANAVVRLFTKEYNKLVSTQVTDSKGRYAFLVGPSTYYVTSQKPGYSQFKSNEIDIKKSEAEAAVLKENVGLLPGDGVAAPTVSTASSIPIAAAQPVASVLPSVAPAVPIQPAVPPSADATQQFAQKAAGVETGNAVDIVNNMRDQAMYGSNDPDPAS